MRYTRAIVLVSGKYLLSYFHRSALMGPITRHVIRNQRFSDAGVKILRISRQTIMRSPSRSTNLRPGNLTLDRNKRDYDLNFAFRLHLVFPKYKYVKLSENSIVKIREIKYFN